MPEDRSLILFTTSLGIGGAEKQVTAIAVGLKKAGWHVEVGYLFRSEHHKATLDAAGVPTFCLGEQFKPLSPGVCFATFKAFRARRPRLLVTFNFPADMVGRVAGKAAGIPVICCSIRNSVSSGGLRSQAYRRTDRWIARTFPNSHRAALRLASLGLMPEEKLSVMPNAFRFVERTFPDRHELRANLELPQDRFVWVAVGNVRDEKDYGTLVSAASILLGLGKEFLLLVAGREGVLGAALKEQVQTLHLEDHVRFLGERNDVSELLAASDAFVLSSKSEGSPNVVLEAASHLVPTVSTDVGDVGTLIETGTTGFVVPIQDSAALARAMGEMMDLKSDERRAMADENYRRAFAVHDLDNVIAKWNAELSALLR